jgi:hypothetical protein
MVGPIGANMAVVRTEWAGFGLNGLLKWILMQAGFTRFRSPQKPAYPGKLPRKF